MALTPNTASPSGAGLMSASDKSAIGNVTPVIDNFTPVTGATLMMTDVPADGLLWISGTGTLAAITIALPTTATSRIGRRRSFGAGRSVTALTITGAATLYNPPASLAPGDYYTLTEVATGIWTTK